MTVYNIYLQNESKRTLIYIHILTCCKAKMPTNHNIVTLSVDVNNSKMEVLVSLDWQNVFGSFSQN